MLSLHLVCSIHFYSFHSPLFTFIYLNSHLSTITHQLHITYQLHCPSFIFIYLSFTFIHPTNSHSHSSTFIHLDSLSPTLSCTLSFIRLHPRLFSLSCIHLPTLIYIHLNSTSFSPSSNVIEHDRLKSLSSNFTPSSFNLSHGGDRGLTS